LRVFVLDKNHEPLMPCHPTRARKLLAKGRAAVFRQAPFTIILKEREGGTCQDLSLQLDPGSKITISEPILVWLKEFKQNTAVFPNGQMAIHTPI